MDTNTLTLVQIAAMQAPLAWGDLPEWLQLFLSDTRRRDEWEATAHALAANDANVGATAAALSVHPNTAPYRLDAIGTACGKDLRDP